MVIAGLLTLAEGRGEQLVIVHGNARGADHLADSLGKQWGAITIPVDADWNLHGKAAGPVRNQRMLDEHDPESVWAFRSTGKSNGTDDMCAKGRLAHKPVYVITT